MYELWFSAIAFCFGCIKGTLETEFSGENES